MIQNLQNDQHNKSSKRLSSHSYIFRFILLELSDMQHIYINYSHHAVHNIPLTHFIHFTHPETHLSLIPIYSLYL